MDETTEGKRYALQLAILFRLFVLRNAQVDPPRTGPAFWAAWHEDRQQSFHEPRADALPLVFRERDQITGRALFEADRHAFPSDDESDQLHLIR